MNLPKKITGEWIKEERLKAFNLFQSNNNDNKGIFTLNKNAIELHYKLMELQNLCPHVFDESNKCIYCLMRKNFIEGENNNE